MNNRTTDNPLIPLGLGIGIGICSLWLLIELWPLVILGGAGYLVVKGMQGQTTKKKETTTQ